MVHEFCIHQLTVSSFQLKTPNGRRPPTLSLDCRSLQVVSSLPLICCICWGWGCTSIMFMGFFVEAPNIHWKTRQLSLWQQLLHLPRLVWIDPATEGFRGHIWGVNQEALWYEFCESPYFETWKLMRYIVPWNGTGVDIPACNDRHASFIVEYMTVQGWSVIRLP